MTTGKKYYILKGNTDLFAECILISLDTVNGHIVLLVIIENYIADYDYLHQHIDKHARLYFEKQFFNNPAYANQEFIAYLGRQIHLEAQHNEVLHGVVLSLVSILFRNKELFLSKIGELNARQLMKDAASGNTVYKELVADQYNMFLKVHNFHVVDPVSAKIRLAEGDQYLISSSDLIKEPDLNKILEGDLNGKTLNKPFVFFSIKQVNSLNDEKDQGFIKKILNLSYFKSIPAWHIGILGLVIFGLVLVLVLTSPEREIQRLEKKFINDVESMLRKELEASEKLIDTIIAGDMQNSRDSLVNVSAGIEETSPESSAALTQRRITIDYRVQAKDNLYRLSKTFNVNLDSLIRINILEDKTIYPGQYLLIPIRKYHEVQQGESLYEIANNYSLSVEQLVFANQLSDVKIADGMKLIIPFPNE